MKLKTKDLIAAFDSVASLANGRTTLPVLNSVRLTREADGLRVTASNLDCFAYAVAPCPSKEPMDLCVNARVFGSVIKTAGDEVELKPLKNQLQIAAGGSVKLATTDGAEFVPWPNGKTTALGLNAADLAECIESVSWAASDEDAGGVLENVWVSTEEKRIQCAASDRNMLGYVNKAAIAAKAEFIFGADYAPRIAAALRLEGASVSTADNFVSVESPSHRLAVKLTEGKFPNVLSIVDYEWRELGELELAPLIDALRLACLVGPGEQYVRTFLNVTPQGIDVTYKGQNSEFQKFVPAKLSSDARLSFNAKKSIRLLENAGDKAKLKFYDGHAVAFECGDKFYSLALMADKA